VRFGGTSQFGPAIYGGEPYAVQPGYYVDRALSALSRFKRVTTGGVTTGFANSIARFTGSIRDRNTAAKIIDIISKAQTPAFFVGFGGGSFTPHTVAGSTWKEQIDLSVICVASHFDSRLRRLEGRNPVNDPGLDAMTGMAITFVMREFLTLPSLKQPEPVDRRYFEFGPKRFVSIVGFRADILHEAFDDAPNLSLPSLERLGICHSPLTLAELFLTDNVTPKVGPFDPFDDDPTASDDPTSPASGVATL